MKTGALFHGDRVLFSVWAPEKEKMLLHVVQPSDMIFEMAKDRWGYFTIEIADYAEGWQYFYRFDGKNDLPDPTSHFQPEGVHGPSQVIDHSSYCWHDTAWRGVPVNDMIIYEIHVGTFTPEGTFSAIIPFLDELSGFGINTIELMPVAQFPGSRNWGYDSVYPYAVQNSYGGPDGLKQLVDACHRSGIAVLLDVVYNHLGPEGNYLSSFGPYFTGKYKVPWGDAINYDDAWSDGVREYFSENPGHWFANYHIDGLRVDAIHSIYDFSAVHFWELVNDKVNLAEQQLGRRFYMIAESDLNSPRVVRSTEMGGFGFDCLWLDDFHHALYAILNSKDNQRYVDFGTTEQLTKAYTEGFVHSGDYVSFRKRKFGATSAGIPGNRFVVFNQNHDQVGNRAMAERLSALVDFNRLKLAAAALLLSPYLPLLFMGEEYGEDNPFFYFISHSDEKLIKAVQEGRMKEFEAFRWDETPPDPQAEETFNRSKIRWEKRMSGKYRILLEWNRKLISLRRNEKSLKCMTRDTVRSFQPGPMQLILHRMSEDRFEHMLCIFNFSDEEVSVQIPVEKEKWVVLLDSTDSRWNENNTDENKMIVQGDIPSGTVVKIKPCSVIVYRNI